MTRLLRALRAALMLPVLLAGGAGCGERIDDGPGASTSDPAACLERPQVTMTRLSYPATRTVDQVDDYHGTAVADPYRWLEDADSPETAAWVAAQNEVTFGFLAGIPQRDAYADRLAEIWDYERYTAPFREGGRTFYYRNDGLQNQYVLYVQDAPAAAPRVLLDPNTLSDDGTVSLGGISVSRDGKWLAWATSVSGSDWREWRVRSIDTGKDLPDVVRWSKFSGATWDAEGRGFWYSRYDAPADGDAFEGTNTNQKLCFHRLGTDQTADRVFHERPDQPEWGFGSTLSEDGRYLVLNVWHGSSRENRLYYKDLFDKSLVVRPLLDAGDANYVFLGNDGPTFYVLTNRDAPRKRIVAIDLDRPDPAHWRELVPEGDDVIDSVTLVDHSFVIKTMRDVQHAVRIHDLAGRFVREVPLPGPGTVSGFGGHADDTDTYFTFTGFLNPGEIHHYDFTTGETTLFRKPAIDFDFDAYTAEQVFFTSRDGTRVPMFLVHRRDLVRDGTNPTILHGYGGFNITQRPGFRISLLPWLEQGGVYALANLRGGGEYGEDWHRAGMLANKQNVFDDFIAAAEHLIGEGYTCAAKLACSGGSNGGLLVGAVVNQRPELWGAALPAVGVMDMLRFQHFTIGWAWVSDYGSSDDAEMFPLLYGYSPYHNLQPGVRYPAVLVTTADHDDRVVPGHSFKYAARLQACQAGDLPVLIRIQTKAGHGAGKPTAMVIQEIADRYAFLHRVLDMEGERETSGTSPFEAALLDADRRFAADVAAAAAADRATVWAGWFAADGRQVVPGAVVSGRDAIVALMAPVFGAPGSGLAWAPDRAVAAGGGDLGWTSGRYVATHAGPDGPVRSEGRYVTVWRRQPDGTWKVDLDTGVPDAR
ncbi:prolyl oligopeptidase family serine peptidase [bacterium]|nr:prolyl oligopeptidase family serine peptidase [bacterium]